MESELVVEDMPATFDFGDAFADQNAAAANIVSNVVARNEAEMQNDVCFFRVVGRPHRLKRLASRFGELSPNDLAITLHTLQKADRKSREVLLSMDPFVDGVRAERRGAQFACGSPPKVLIMIRCVGRYSVGKFNRGCNILSPSNCGSVGGRLHV